MTPKQAAELEDALQFLAGVSTWDCALKHPPKVRVRRFYVPARKGRVFASAGVRMFRRVSRGA